MAKRELAVYTEGVEDGQFGQAITFLAAIKLFTLTMIMTFGTWVTCYILGDRAEKIIDWFNEYENDTKTEGRDKTSNDLDPDGTSIQYDLLYHSIFSVYAFIVFAAIELGGII